MPAGRPTLLTDDLKEQAREYLKETGNYVSQLIVTIEGLALALNCNRDSLYQWEKDDEEFSDILEQLRQLQAERLLQFGLTNRYNPTITKLMLSKHDYIEKKTEDHTSGGEKINFIPLLGGASVPENDSNRETPQTQ